MSFKVWFKLWRRYIYMILTFDRKRKVTDAQREKARRKRIEDKFSPRGFLKTKKERRRGVRGSAADRRLIEGLLGFSFTTLAIILLPLGLFDWAKKSNAERKKRYTNHNNKGVRSNASKTSKTRANLNSKPEHTKITADAFGGKSDAAESQKGLAEISYSNMAASNKKTVVAKAPEIVADANDDAPRSIPRCEKDKYIRKRLVVPLSNNGDSDLAENINVGSYLEIEGALDDTINEAPIKIVLNGKTVGGIEKSEGLAVFTCLKLGRKLYAAVVGIDTNCGDVKIEIEIWIAAYDQT